MMINGILSTLRCYKKTVISLTIVLLVICEFILRFENFTFLNHSLAIMVTIVVYRIIVFPCFIFILLTCFDVWIVRTVYITIGSALVSIVYFYISESFYIDSLLKQSYYKVAATVTKVEITSGTRFGSNIYISYEYNWLKSGKIRSVGRKVTVNKDKIRVGTKLFVLRTENNWESRSKFNISKEDAYYYQYPVLFVNEKEVGNDYYYYAKLNPTLALKNFGLNRVFLGRYNNDTLLVYKNINDSIEFKTLHVCANTLQTAANRAIVGNSFAFIFHDSIYSKEQVFKEIPQAKEYYLKYYKEIIIPDTTTNAH